MKERYLFQQRNRERRETERDKDYHLRILFLLSFILNRNKKVK